MDAYFGLIHSERAVFSARAGFYLADHLAHLHPKVNVVTVEMQNSRPGGRKAAFPRPKPPEVLADRAGRWDSSPCRACWDPGRGALLGGVGLCVAPVPPRAAAGRSSAGSARQRAQPSPGCYLVERESEEGSCHVPRWENCSWVTELDIPTAEHARSPAEARAETTGVRSRPPAPLALSLTLRARTTQDARYV